MLLGTQSLGWSVAFAANLTTTSVQLTQALTLPDGVILLGDETPANLEVPSSIEIIPFGEGSDGETFHFSIWSLRKVPGKTSVPRKPAYWFGTKRATFTGTLDSSGTFPAGVAENGNLTCKTIAAAGAFADNFGTSYEVISSGVAGDPASVLFDPKGSRAIALLVDVNDATSVNFLVSRV